MKISYWKLRKYSYIGTVLLPAVLLPLMAYLGVPIDWQSFGFGALAVAALTVLAGLPYLLKRLRKRNDQ